MYNKISQINESLQKENNILKVWVSKQMSAKNITKVATSDILF